MFMNLVFVLVVFHNLVVLSFCCVRVVLYVEHDVVITS